MLNQLARVFAPMRLWQGDEPLPADFRPQFDLKPPFRSRLRPTRPRQSWSAEPPPESDRIGVSLGDLAALDIDAVVTLATSDLRPVGYGHNAAIHYAAGPALLAECRKLGACAPGGAVLTRGHRMKAKWIVHTVPPGNGITGQTERIASSFRNVLRLAADAGAASIAVPSLFPARIAVREARAWCMVNARPVQIMFCLPDEQSAEAYRACLAA